MRRQPAARFRAVLLEVGPCTAGKRKRGVSADCQYPHL